MQDHMLWLGWIVNEASLKIIVPMICTRLSRVVANFKHVYLTLYVECVLNKQVRSSRQVDFVIKATFQEWNGNFLPKMANWLGQCLEHLDNSSKASVIF